LTILPQRAQRGDFVERFIIDEIIDETCAPSRLRVTPAKLASARLHGHRTRRRSRASRQRRRGRPTSVSILIAATPMQRAAILQPCQSILGELLYLWVNAQRNALLPM
jgi:hypothetical protein